MSRFTCSLAVSIEPLVDVAVTVTMFGPSAKGTDALKAPFAFAVGIELMMIVAVGSLTVPLMVVGLMVEITQICWQDEMVMVGGGVPVTGLRKYVGKAHGYSGH